MPTTENEGVKTLAWLIFKGAFKKNPYTQKLELWTLWSYGESLPAPIIELRHTHTETGWRKGAYVEEKFFAPHLRYNNHRRPNKAYTEWPDLLLFSTYGLAELRDYGLVQATNLDPREWPEQLMVKTIFGKATYEKYTLADQSDAFSFYTKKESKGSFRVKPEAEEKGGSRD